MGSDGKLVLFALAAAASVVAVVALLGKKKEAGGLVVPSGTLEPLGMFPDLKVGDVVLVDSQAARLPAPFNLTPQQIARVDRILSDPFSVSVACGVSPAQQPFFSGTIFRAAILKVVSIAPPGGLQV